MAYPKEEMTIVAVEVPPTQRQSHSQYPPTSNMGYGQGPQGPQS